MKMPMIQKSKLPSFAKKSLTPPPAAQLLAQKRAMAKAAVAPSAPAGVDHAEMEKDESDHMVMTSELVEEAAQEAEAGADQDLEDAIAGTALADPGTPPAWATDKEKWKEAAEAVGLGDEMQEDRYDEPIVVAAYLYKKLGGAVAGAEIPPAPDAPVENEGAGMKPGAAAKAIKAKQMGAAAPAPDAGTAMGEGADPVDEAAQEWAANPDPDLQAKLQGYDPEVDGNPPQWVTDEAKWEKAKAAVEPRWEEFDEPYAVVATVYKKMGGELK